ncbi:hypothetical protein UlMin_022379 [Ulmus minor]
MENFLRSKEYWHIVEVGVAELAACTTLTNQQRTNVEGQKLKDLKTGESILEYISSTMTIANKRQINEEKLEDVTIVEKILQSLTTKFNYVICVIKESKEIDTLSIDELQSSLLVHEKKIVQQDKEEKALQDLQLSLLYKKKPCKPTLH